jgi:hypothetical protein
MIQKQCFDECKKYATYFFLFFVMLLDSTRYSSVVAVAVAVAVVAVVSIQPMMDDVQQYNSMICHLRFVD